MTDSPKPPDPSFAAAARSALDALQFNADAIATRLGGRPQIIPREQPRLRYLTRDATPLDVAIRLFMLQDEVPRPAVERALPRGQLDRWRDAGLLDVQETGVVARFAIACVYGLRIVYDRPARGHPPSDFVVGIGRSSQIGIRATPRKPIGSALEIGTGCGGAALMLARHAQRVVATDVNPRALGIAAFNAALNDIHSIEFRAGSLFEPVAGERFDLIVSNPPFVVAPEREFAFRDSGLGGDAFVERLIRDAPLHLLRGGHCVSVANWIEPQGTPWQEKLTRWASEGDTLFVRMDRFAPDDYAAVWLAETLSPDSPEFEASWQRWREYLALLGVEAIGGGLIAQCAGALPARAWFLDGVRDLDDEGGARLAHLLEARAHLASLDDRAILDVRPRILPGLVIEDTVVSRGEGWETSSAKLVLRHGLHLSLPIEPGVANLIGRCNGERSVREIIATLASDHSLPAESFAPVAIRMVRTLIEKGAIAIELRAEAA